MVRPDEQAADGIPGKLRSSAFQINSLFAVSNCTICRFTSRTSDVVNVDPGSLNTAMTGVCRTGGGGGGGGDGDGVALLPHPMLPPTNRKRSIAVDVFMVPSRTALQSVPATSG
jgi:hypothetical protein